jgi:hypothetical protein
MLKRWMQICSALLLFLLAAPFADATVITWKGAGADTQWTTPGNWSGGVVPGLRDIATFTNATTKNAYIPTNISVSGINVTTYAGIITQSGGSVVTVGTGALRQAAGTYKGGTGSLANGSGVVISGGTFTAPLRLTLSGSWTKTAGTFTRGNGTVTFNGAGIQKIFTNTTTSISTFNILTVNKPSGTLFLTNNQLSETV